jgi:hypothetical protein
MMVRLNKHDLQELVLYTQDYFNKVEECGVPIDKFMIDTLRKIVNARDKAWGGSTIDNFKWLKVME